MRQIYNKWIAFGIALCLFLFALPAKATEASPASLLVSFEKGTSIITERIVSAMLGHLDIPWQATYNASQTTARVSLGQAGLLPVQAGELESRYSNLLRVPVPVSGARVTAYTRNDALASITKWEDLQDRQMACLCENPYVIMKARQYGIPLHIYDTVDELWQALLQQDADIAVLSPLGYALPAIPEGVHSAGTFETPQAYFYLNRANQALLEPLTIALQAMQADGTLATLLAGRTESGNGTVIHITSNDSDMDWERDYDMALRDEWEGGSAPTIYRFSLNAQRAIDQGRQADIIRQDLHGLLLGQAPGAVLCTGDAAAAFVTQYYQELFPGCPVVCTSAGRTRLDALRTVAASFTGCTESISASATVQYMLTLYPQIQTIYIINDYSEAGRAWQRDIQSHLDRLSLNVSFEYNPHMTTAQLLETLRSFGDTTLVLLGSWFTDANGQFMSEQRLQREICAVLQTPLFVLTSSSVGDGALGGMVLSAETHGQAAGSMVRRILQGEGANSIATLYASESMNEWLFDASVLKQFHLTTADLPADYRLVNATPSLWEAFPAEALGAGLLAALLLGAVTVCLLVLRGMARKNRALRAAENQTEQENPTLASQHPVLTRQNLALLENVMERVSMMFIVAVDGTLLACNRYVRDSMGMLPGTPAIELHKNPGTYQKIERGLQESGMMNNQLILCKMKTGQTHRHLGHYVSITYDGKPGYLSFATDIETLEQQKLYIKRTQEDLQKLLDALPTALAIISQDTSALQYANTTFLALMGFAYFDEAKAFDYSGMMEQVFALWQGKTASFEYSDEKLVQKGLHVKMYADQIVYEGQSCMVLIAQDVTAETRQNEMLARAAEKERQANQLKSTFLANMSHEIRTPMNAIIGLSQLAILQGKPEEANDYFQKINTSANNLLSIINDILDFSKIEAEKMDFIEAPFDLEDTISNVFLVATERVEKKRVEVLLNMHTDVPCRLIGDKTRLWQVLKNIIDNAVKYTQEGRVMLDVSVEREETERITLAFTVRDTGVGMTQAQVEQLFTPFQQFHRDVSKKAGTGLGLAITHRLVDMMGGSISVQSKENEGSEFRLSIPFTRDEDRRTLPDSLLNALGDSLKNIGEILLLDDDECSLATMTAILENVGIASVQARNIETAHQLIAQREAEGKPFSIIIVDYLLGREGDETGLDFARKISTTDHNTKLLMVTAYLRRFINEEDVYAAGIRDIIEKPYVVSSFLETICNVLPSAAPQAEQPVHEQFPAARVLMCEDNELNQMIARGVLEMYGIHPDVAANGQQGLDMLEKNTYDLVLMDVIMPVMDGLEATRIIRGSAKPYKDVPIVALTANVMSDDIEKYTQLGMNDHLEKPINVEAFYQILKKYLDNK